MLTLTLQLPGWCPGLGKGLLLFRESAPLSLSPILDCSCLKGVIIGEGGVASLEREVLRLDLRILPFYLLVPMGLWLYLPTEDSCLL